MPANPRVLVVGAGSAGKRHMRNLLSLGASVLAVRYRTGAAAAADPLPDGVVECSDLDNALNRQPDAVVVANRTDLHVDVATRAAARGIAFYVEKPLSNSMRGVAELLALVKSNDVVAEAGFMLRFHPNLQWIRSHLQRQELGRIRYARALVGQFLPEWRPGADHRDNYAARRAWGGGVIFDLIHELDVIVHLLGEVVEVTALTAQVAELEIETEAIAQIGLRMASGALAQVHLDYVRRGYARNLEIAGDEGVLMWDYVSGVVTRTDTAGSLYEAHRVPADFSRNSLFMGHMSHFIHRLGNSDARPAASLDEGVSALRLALAAHASAQSRRVIALDDFSADGVQA